MKIDQNAHYNKLFTITQCGTLIKNIISGCNLKYVNIREIYTAIIKNL